MGEILRFVPVPIGGEVGTPDGGRIRAEYEDPSVARRDHVNTDGTPKHEAGHGVVAELTGTPVVSMEVGLSGNVRGVTQLVFANPIAAGSSFDESGNGYDREIVRSMGLSESAMGSAARTVKNRAKDQIHEVAAEVAIKGKVSGHQVREAMKDGKEGRKVIVLFKDRAGRNKKEIKTRVKGQVAMIRDIEYELPQVA